MKFVLHFIFTISLSILTIKTDIVVTFFLTIILKLWLDVFVHNLHIDNKYLYKLLFFILFVITFSNICNGTYLETIIKSSMSSFMYLNKNTTLTEIEYCKNLKNN